MVVLDFETRSRCDLKACGVDNYATDPSTDILCLCIIDKSQNLEQTWLWFPILNEEMPEGARRAILDASLVIALNARFDQAIWECVGVEKYDFPELPSDNWYCASAQARVNAFPASLDDATRALDAKHRKNPMGAQLIRDLCIPKKDGTFCLDRDKLTNMGIYCIDDVKATIEIVEQTRSMLSIEHEDWLINERINDRGVKVDLELAKLAQNYAGAETAEIAVELSRLTAGEITKHTQSARINKWVRAHLGDEHPAVKLMEVHKDDGIKYSLDKNIRAHILDGVDALTLDIPDNVYEVIALTDDGNKSSVSKFGKMLTMADPDTDRVYGAFVYAGASQTMRYASRGLQLHNMKRDCFTPAETEHIKSCMYLERALTDLDGEPLPVMDTLSKLLRPAIIPEDGHKLVVGDWSSIEARALPWLADTGDSRKRLELFRDGVDIYMKTAEDLRLDNRQIGKVAELALGYGGNVGAFNAMGKNYGVVLPEYQIKGITSTWREVNSWAVEFWDQLEYSAVQAIKRPNELFHAGRIDYQYIPDMLEGTLLCFLPCGGCIQYPKARLEKQTNEYGSKWVITAMKAGLKPKKDAKEWPRVTLWRGLLAENVTQATCASLLRWLLRNVNHAIGHVHDEVVLEVPEEYATSFKVSLGATMCRGPSWAKGLPLAAEPVIMDRYGK